MMSSGGHSGRGGSDGSAAFRFQAVWFASIEDTGCTPNNGIKRDIPADTCRKFLRRQKSDAVGSPGIQFEWSSIEHEQSIWQGTRTTSNQ